MVAGGHRIIAEDALNLVESLSLSTPTHGHTLTYTSTDNRTRPCPSKRLPITLVGNLKVRNPTQLH